MDNIFKDGFIFEEGAYRAYVTDEEGRIKNRLYEYEQDF